MKSIYHKIIFLLMIVGFASTGLAQDNAQVGLPDGAIARLGKGGIKIMRFSPDGSKLAVGTDVGVWLYDVPDGNVTALFAENPGKVYALAFSNDGNILASGGSGNSAIQLWNLEEDISHSILSFKRGFRTVVALGFFGNTLISYDKSGKITYWNISNGEILAEIAKVNPNQAVTVSPTTNYIVVADQMNKIHIYDTSLSDKHIVLQDDELKNGILALSVTKNRKKLVSGDGDNFIRIWDIEERKLIASLNLQNTTITSVAISPDDKIFASGDAKKEIILWDLDNPKKLRSLKGHKSIVKALTFSPEGTNKYSGCLASGSRDGTIRFWNPDTGEELVTFAIGHTKWIKAIAFSENGSTLVSANMTGTVDVWSLNGYQEIATFNKGESDYAASVAFSTDAKYFACQGLNDWEFTFKQYGFGYSSRSGDSLEILPLQMWDITTGKEVIGPWNDHSCNILAFSPDNEKLAIYGSENVLGWNIDSGAELFDLSTGDMSFSENMVMSPESKYLAMYESSDKPFIWNIENPEDPPIRTKSRIDSLAFSPDGNYIAVLSSESIFLHDLEMFPDDEPKEISNDVLRHEFKMIFSPDNKFLVGAGIVGVISNIRIKLWDVETGEEIRTLAGHTEPIATLAFSHDGKILASGSIDGTVLVWDWEKISNRKESVQ